MGKSAASCFQLVRCGDQDAVDRDELPAAEAKDSSDKRKWSFRKKSARYRVLSDSVISETSLVNTASLDTATVAVQKQDSCTNTDSKVSEAISQAEEKSAADVTPDEFTIIIIQTGIRAFLAQKMLMKQKGIIMLQAAIRGHIVRKTAVESLRCVQGIVKMQVLIRKHCARLLLEGSKFNGNDGKLNKRNAKGMENLGNKPAEEITSNMFARQLLESNPWSKTINIKCEPLKSDSAWKWMERWTSISSTGSNKSPNTENITENPDEKCCEELEYQLDNDISHKDICQSTEMESSNEESEVHSEGVESTISHGLHDFDSNNDMGRPCSVTNCREENRNDMSDSLPNQRIESRFTSKTETDFFTNQPEMQCKQHIDLVNRSDSGESETTRKKVLFGSRKASNPAFIAAQSKFEGLSLAVSSAKPAGLSKKDASLQLCSAAISPAMNARTEETVPAETSLLPASEVDVVGSECGTELSISSTLDSPDGHVIGASKVEKATAVLEDKDDYQKNHTNSSVDNGVESSILEGELTFSKSFEEERCEKIAVLESKDESSAMAIDSLEADEKPETDESGVVKKHMQTEIGQLRTVSPEASPRSHVTVPDSQETPSSHISVKANKSSAKSVDNYKRKSLSSGKGCPSDSNHDSGARNGSEQLPKDNKTGKRRISFGSARTDHGNQEPRDSGSSNSLPSYMQATESARAKAILNNSLRSSPDVLDKDIHIKKRHSLPGAKTKHGSPHAQQSMSQQLQDAKANGVHSPQERKWRR